MRRAPARGSAMAQKRKARRPAVCAPHRGQTNVVTALAQARTLHHRLNSECSCSVGHTRARQHGAGRCRSCSGPCTHERSHGAKRQLQKAGLSTGLTLPHMNPPTSHMHLQHGRLPRKIAASQATASGWRCGQEHVAGCASGMENKIWGSAGPRLRRVGQSPRVARLSPQLADMIMPSGDDE